jgi:HEPN domain-containing protein
MVDISKQVAYWQKGAEEDFPIAEILIQQGHTRHGLFFAHLALEKLLKALVCRRTNDLAPRIHNLVRLSEIAELPLTEDQKVILAELNIYNVEGRYPDTLFIEITQTQATEVYRKAKEVFAWLITSLSQ